MRTLMHYLIALAVAGLITLGGVVFVRQTHAELRQRFKESAATQKFGRPLNQLTPAEDAELDAEFERKNFGMTLPNSLQIRLDTAMLLEGLWYIWVPLTLAICFGVAVAYGWIRGRPGSVP